MRANETTTNGVVVCAFLKKYEIFKIQLHMALVFSLFSLFLVLLSYGITERHRTRDSAASLSLFSP